MGEGSANRALRTLLEAGATGSLTDARLVERFVVGVDQEREDAFTALVERHGPMVRGVCRRMLVDPADADDAFQAVFLILARKAGALRRAEGLKPWLHGVAVRVAKESRRRSERIRAREGGALVDVPAPAARDDLFELRAAVDEELNRLPKRHREPILLCDLEGAPRREAARRLGLAEGTLSSRLARGRSLLRDRLTRRGLSVGSLIPLFPEFGAPALGPLADVAVRRALAFTARDAVPAGLASLAEGVLQMLAASKLKSALLAGAVSLCAIGLTAGLARGFGGGQEPQAAPVVTAPKEAETERPRRALEARGMVVDEEGRPIAGAEVLLAPYSTDERRGVTDADGAFAIAIPKPEFGLAGRPVLVRADDGRKLGFFRYEGNLIGHRADGPARIVVGPPGRVVTVRVADGDGAPIADAIVEASARFTVLAHATTGADGVALLPIPRDLGINWIVARKDGAGYDYAELGVFSAEGVPEPGDQSSEPPDSVFLMLNAPRTVRIRTLEPDGSPAFGVLLIARIRAAGRRSAVMSGSRLYSAITNAQGLAAFDWLPTSPEELQIISVSDRHVRRSITVAEGQTEATETLVRLESIRGRVRLPDGSPAADTPVSAHGKKTDGERFSFTSAETRTGADGSYELKVEPNASHVVAVASKEWRAPARFGLIVRPGEPVEGVDFQLGPGTVFRVTVTVGPDNQPAPGQYVRIVPAYYAPSPEVGFNFLSPISALDFSGFTDAQGSHEFRLARGIYRLIGPNPDQSETFAIDDGPGPEVVRDLHIDRLEMGCLRGTVVAGPEGAAVLNAPIVVQLHAPGQPNSVCFTDERGRFEMRRPLRRTTLRASNEDGSLGALMEIGPDENDITIRLDPTATATGVLLDSDGEIAKGEEIPWGYWVEIEREDGRWRSFRNVGPRIVTDDQGRFTLRGLILGERREIGMIRNRKFLKAGVVQPEEPGQIDLGTLRAEPLEAGRPFP